MPDALYLPYPSIGAVFEAVMRHEVERGLVPIENVIQGPVTESLDNLYRYAEQLKLVDMLVLPIQHALGVLAPETHIRRVLSKDQALKQCSVYLQGHYPHAQQVEMASTSFAMEAIITECLYHAAAIGSPQALQQYGLHILARDIGNVQHNKTRFAVLGAAAEAYHGPTGNDATALVIYPHRDRIGLLEDISRCSAKHTGSISRPSIHALIPVGLFVSIWRSRVTWKTRQ